MSINGKNTRSLRKKDIISQKNLTIGFKKTMFAHKATAGATGIDLTALSLPSEMTGFTNPTAQELAAAQVYFYRKNLTLVSSIRGPLMDYLSYNIATSNRINFNGFTAEDGEIFIGVIDYNARNGLQVVDAAPLTSSGTLAIGATDYNVGQAFEVNKYSSSQVGAVIVFRNGAQQFRNSNNSSVTLDGNYYEVNNGSGLGSIIRFNTAPASQDDSILVVSNGLLVYNPDGSALQQIETLAGQIDAMVPTLAALAGVDETDFQAAPNNVDLKSFGDIVLALLDAEVPITTDWTNYSPATNVTGGGTATSGRWRRVGSDMELQLMISWTSAPSAFSFLNLGLPSGLSIDTSKILTTLANGDHFGTGTYFDDSGGTTRYLVDVTYSDANTLEMRYVVQVSGASTIVHVTDITNASPFGIGSGDYLVARAKIPIAGWAATQTLREQLGL
jgi:hypothetical protein